MKAPTRMNPQEVFEFTERVCAGVPEGPTVFEFQTSTDFCMDPDEYHLVRDCIRYHCRTSGGGVGSAQNLCAVDRRYFHMVEAYKNVAWRSRHEKEAAAAFLERAGIKLPGAVPGEAT